MRALRGALATAGAAAVLAAVAAPAGADSIVYVRGGNVWRVSPDGAVDRQLTSEPVYGEPSQADDGSLIASAGVHRLRRLDRDGNVTADFAAAALADENWAGPFDPDLSPDGTKVAYSWQYESRGETTPGCPLSPDECRLGYIRTGTTVSWSDRPTALGELGWMRYWTTPSWIGNDRLLLGGHDVVGARAGSAGLGLQGSGVETWFGEGVHLADGDVTRAGDRMAWVAGIGQNELAVFETNGPPGAAEPRLCVVFTDPSGHFADPSWSPDGRSLAWGEEDGIWVADIPGCSPEGVSSRKLVGSGRFPDWGPADATVVQQQPPPPPPPPADPQRRTDPPGRTDPPRRTPAAKRCVVPKVKAGATLATASRALARGNCRVVTKRVRSTRIRRGRVVKLSAKAGRTLAVRARVTVYLSRGRR